MNIIVTGSLAYDRIMDFPGHFSEHILPEKIHMLNISFTVNGLVEKFGGTAGNIAYNLALLGEKPTIVATIGRDYHRYFDWLKKNNLTRDGITIIEDELTAGAYITTDQADNQITGFNPGAMKYVSPFDFSKLEPKDTIAIVSPGNLDDMINTCQSCKAMGIDYIFDPGQSLPMWEPGDMLRCIEGSRVLISNDYELELICDKTGLDKKGLLGLTETIITTLGERGACVITADSEFTIPPVNCNEVVDPTGAGDAFRAGLIKGLIEGRGLKRCAEMGAVCSSFAIEHYGTQEHSFDAKDFASRLPGGDA